MTMFRRVVQGVLSFALALGSTSPALADRVAIYGPVGEYYSVPVTSLREARFKTTVRQQYDFSCGSAAVATLLTFQYGESVSEELAFANMFVNGDQDKIRREGFSLLDMKRFLESRGYLADGYELPLSKLEETQIPAIVLISEGGYHHFVVVKGVKGNRVLIGDPARGTRSISREHFESIWESQLLFVIHNRTELARFNLAADWRVAPMGPYWMGVNRDSLFFTVMPKHGASDF
ncbi:hypothetical protein LMG31506_03359 [Cupriavidus yeoncheonensis]|uniref:Peptidase C39 domain-containing protein n=2 Tax=Cupriavidus yeoncheonensis TaxID=1462994 RepID=A0A916IW60_9BURK|nr:C39 family peptidase [Cupriavidus yeoncheonensis]CAG2146236.1 hypothetical protein LMG31506_03359 [Cupriavidus yeoncheonensis]